MEKISANIYIDSETNLRAQEILADFGMDLSTAVNIFLRQMIRDNAFPFTITREIPNKTTLDAMKDADNDILIGPFDSVSALMESLNADD